jgi:hypothetical protein
MKPPALGTSALYGCLSQSLKTETAQKEQSPFPTARFFDSEKQKTDPPPDFKIFRNRNTHLYRLGENRDQVPLPGQRLPVAYPPFGAVRRREIARNRVRLLTRVGIRGISLSS